MTRPIRLLVGATALAAIVVATAVPVAADTARPTRARAATEPTAETTDRTVVATGTAKVRGVPDVLTMTLGVTSRADTVGAALDRNNAAVGKVMDVLTDAGVDEKDVQTSSFSIGPVYDDRGAKVTGYQVSNLVTVTLRDLARAGTLIDRAAQAGGDDVVMHGVSFSFDDASGLVARARAEAVRRARAQAEQLAQAAGVELVAVRTISESSPDAGPVLSAPEASARADTGVAIAPGSEELSVQVTVVYTIR
jgi:hypothetical protein